LVTYTDHPILIGSSVEFQKFSCTSDISDPASRAGKKVGRERKRKGEWKEGIREVG